MKPVIIYSLPRTRSTAILQACVRPIKLHEPFDHFTLYGADTNNAWNFYPRYANKSEQLVWPYIKDQLNDPRAVSKFFGNSLLTFPPARSWFEEADRNETHDIFVAVRDRRETAWSYLLAHKFGWVKGSESESKEVEIEPRFFFFLAYTFDNFLRFFPKNATLIEYETLPASHFDKSLIEIQDQESAKKRPLIKNREFCEEQIDSIIQCYDREWQSKVASLTVA